MALTLGTQKKFSEGARFKTVTPITVDTSYPAGGWSLTPAQLGLPLGLIDDVYASYEGITAVGAAQFDYDPVNQKLMAFNGGTSSTAASEVTATTNISTWCTNLQVVATGR